MNTYKAIRNEISSDNMMATVHQLANQYLTVLDIQPDLFHVKHI